MTQTIAQEATRLEHLVNDCSPTRARVRRTASRRTCLGVPPRGVTIGAAGGGSRREWCVGLDVPEEAPSIAADPEQMKQLFGTSR